MKPQSLKPKQSRPNRQKKAQKQHLKKQPTTKLERQLLSQGFSRIIGIDEVGRGAWAGPVVVGAFVYTQSSPRVKHVADSKLLSREMRELLAPRLSSQSHLILQGSLEQINSIGVGKTIEGLIHEIIRQFDDGSTYFLVDGRFAPSFHSNSSQIISGDMLHYSISAASVLAKVFRDNYMRTLALDYPGYDFEANVGYPTPAHMKGLHNHGVCSLHRTSFRPIAQLSQQYKLVMP